MCSYSLCVIIINPENIMLFQKKMKNSMRKNWEDIISSCLFIGISGICVLGILLMTRREFIAVFWPLVICFLLGVFSLFTLIKVLLNIFPFQKSKKTVEKEPFKIEKNKKGMENGPDYLKVSFIGLSILIYSYITRIIGFWLSTPMFIITILFILGERKKTTILLAGVLTTIAFIILFGYALGTPLPKGMFVFRRISIFLYD